MEYDFGYDRMAKKDTCGWPWLICWGSIVSPKVLGVKLGCCSNACKGAKMITLLLSSFLNTKMKGFSFSFWYCIFFFFLSIFLYSIMPSSIVQGNKWEP